jgi:predicted transposase YdaD
MVEREVRTMPILNDILDDEVLGREFKRGLQLGEQKGELKGRQEGKQEGLQEGELKADLSNLRRLIRKRFGAIPVWAEEQIAQRTAPELEALIERVLDASTIEDLLK